MRAEIVNYVVNLCKEYKDDEYPPGFEPEDAYSAVEVEEEEEEFEEESEEENEDDSDEDDD